MKRERYLEKERELALTSTSAMTAKLLRCLATHQSVSLKLSVLKGNLCAGTDSLCRPLALNFIPEHTARIASSNCLNNIESLTHAYLKLPAALLMH